MGQILMSFLNPFKKYRRRKGYIVQSRTSGPLFRCKKCRMVLASHASVLPHRSGRSTPDWKELSESRQQQNEEQEMEKEGLPGVTLIDTLETAYKVKSLIKLIF